MCQYLAYICWYACLPAWEKSSLENFFPPARVVNNSSALGIGCWSICLTLTGFTVILISLHTLTVPSGLGMGTMVYSYLLLFQLPPRPSGFLKHIISFSITGCKAYGADIALQNLGIASGLTHSCTCMFFIVPSSFLNRISCLWLSAVICQWQQRLYSVVIAS